LQPKFKDVNCAGRGVIVKWINHGQDAYSDIWNSCVYYNCTTDGGTVTGEMVS